MTETSVQGGATIAESLTRAIAAHVDRIAIEHGDRRVTYAQLDRAANALASTLSRSGVGPGSMVPILLDRSAEYIVSVVAVLRCGGAYVPIDSAAPPRRRASMLDQLRERSRVAIAHDTVEGWEHIEPRIDADSKVEFAPASRTPASPAYAMFTSGTTGAPKGVVVPDRAIVRLVVDADYARFGPERRWGLLSALAFDASTLELWGALLNGGCCVVQPQRLLGLDELARFITDNRITDAWLTASLFNAMIDSHATSLAQLDQLLVGGERESIKHIRLALESCPATRLIHGYGPTENTTFSLCHTITNHSIDAATNRIPIGTPINGSTARIASPDGDPDASLREGELLVGGLGLALGYLGNDELTAQRFVTDARGKRWYRTGDLVRTLDNGLVEFLGRIDRQVKIRGHRIEPDEIERLLNTCPDVRQGVIFVSGDTAETRHLVAAFVPEENAASTDVRVWLEQELSRAMMPQRIERIEALPTTPNGKIDRSAIAHLVETPVGPQEAPQLAEERLSPTEQRVADAIAAVVDITPTRQADFIELGGHSLAAMRVAARLGDALGIAISPADVLRARTVAGIAAVAETAARKREAPQPRERTSPTLASIPQRLFFESLRDETGIAFLIHLALRLDPPIDPTHLQQAVQRVAARHPALLTPIELDPHRGAVSKPMIDVLQWTQHNAAGVDVDADAGSHTTTLSRTAVRTIHRPLATERGVARADLFAATNAPQVLVLTIHHAVVDEWSLDILRRDLALELEAPVASGSLDAGPHPSAFADFERDALDPSLVDHLTERISATADNQVRALHPGGGRASVRTIELDADGFDRAVARLGVSPAAYGLASLGLALRQSFGPAGSWVLTPIAKRHTAALQRLVACCLDMRPVEVAGDRLADAAAGVHEQLLAAQEPAMLDLAELARRLHLASPEAAALATQFGFTYRLIGDEPTPAGSTTLTPIDVPIHASRFLLALHIERRGSQLRCWIEAAADAFDAEALDRFGELFAAIALGCDAEADDAPAIDVRSSSDNAPLAKPVDTPVDSETRAQLALAWQGVLHVEPKDDHDFFDHGGSSLAAMRLALDVHRRLGQRLHVNEFLAAPTFAGLVRSISSDPEHPIARFGSGDGPTLVGIPGSGGRAVGLLRLWDAFGSTPPLPSMLALDLCGVLDGIEQRAEPESTLDAMAGRIAGLIDQERPEGPLTIVGYSLGALLTLDVGARLANMGHDVDRLVLLDGYAPGLLRTSLMRKSLSGISRLLSDPRELVASRLAKPAKAPVYDDSQRARWRELHRAIPSWQPPSTSLPVSLIRSGPAARRMGVIRHRRTNGLGPWLMGSVAVRTIEIEHLDVLNAGVAEVARAISAELAADQAGAAAERPSNGRFRSEREPSHPIGR